MVETVGGDVQMAEDSGKGWAYGEKLGRGGEDGRRQWEGRGSRRETVEGEGQMAGDSGMGAGRCSWWETWEERGRWWETV